MSEPYRSRYMCERCWADSHDARHREGTMESAYSRLVRERNERGEVCSKEQQIGQWMCECGEDSRDCGCKEAQDE